MASQWAQIAEIEAFVGRTWQLGDPVGSQVVATQIVEKLIHICFLMECKYAPYVKWLYKLLTNLVNIYNGVIL